jgi:DNA-binding transcriptional LysR family regulator
MLDPRRLRLLRELDLRGTIAGVAEAFSFSPSAISQQLAQLEREAGVQLLERVGRGVRLTPAARGLLGQIDTLLEQLGEVEAALARIGDEATGVVRLATFQTAALALVPPALTALATRSPAVQVEVVVGEPEDSLPALARGEVDLVIAEDYPGNPRRRDPRVDRRPLGQDGVMLALPAAHPLARSGGSVRLSALAGEAWAFALPGTFYAQMALRACQRFGGFAPQIRHQANDLTVLLALVAGGHAVAFVPELLGDGGPDIAIRDVAERRLERTVFTAARRSSAGHPAIAAVRAALQDVAGERMAPPAAA